MLGVSRQRNVDSQLGADSGRNLRDSGLRSCLSCIFDAVCSLECAREGENGTTFRFHRFIPLTRDPEYASLELNVRGWTPGVEPCAETKSSRHCHLGRDARIFTLAGECPPPLSAPFPILSSPTPPSLSLLLIGTPPLVARKSATFRSICFHQRTTSSSGYVRSPYPCATRRFSCQFVSFPFIAPAFGKIDGARRESEREKYDERRLYACSLKGAQRPRGDRTSPRERERERRIKHKEK